MIQDLPNRLRQVKDAESFGELFGEPFDWWWANVSSKMADEVVEYIAMNTPICEDAHRETCSVLGTYRYDSEDVLPTAVFRFHLSCGHELEWSDKKPPAYCPDCGARVEF